MGNLRNITGRGRRGHQVMPRAMDAVCAAASWRFQKSTPPGAVAALVQPNIPVTGTADWPSLPKDQQLRWRVFFVPKNPCRRSSEHFLFRKIHAAPAASNFSIKKSTPPRRGMFFVPKSPRRRGGSHFLLRNIIAAPASGIFRLKKSPLPVIAPLFSVFYGKTINKGDADHE